MDFASSEDSDIQFDDEEEDEDQELYVQDDGDEPGESNGDGSSDGVFVVCSPDEIAQHMMESIQEVNEIFKVDFLTARCLLVHFKWDKETLLEKYYDGDPEKLMEEAKVVVRVKVAKPAECCDICLMDTKEADMTPLPCGHAFCNICWCTYLTTMIMDEGIGQHITCAGHNCNVLIDELTVSRLLVSPDVKKKYTYLMSKNFVEANRLYRWCPGQGCSNAIKCRENSAHSVKCKCGVRFCFQCLQPVHDPVTCYHLKNWLKKCEDGSETARWMQANTKECPNCKASIEKNGGCNHMVCRNAACKSEFCWVCLGPWQPHGTSWYNCNRYNERNAEEARDVQSKSREALNRYLFFCDRYLNHHRSGRLEQKLLQTVERKVEDLQVHGMAWIETQFLSNGVDALFHCRAVLKYSYVFAYFLRKNNQALIFMDNQKDFEMATEELSGYLERDLANSSLAQLKIDVQDKSEYCKSRCKKLLAHVNEGYENDWWEYLDSSE